MHSKVCFRKQSVRCTRVERCIKSSVKTSVRESEELVLLSVEIGHCLGMYFEENVHLKPFLQRLREANKQMFLITNSAFWYVNHGMTYLLGKDWRDFFDVVICQARKPSFFGALKRSIIPLLKSLTRDQRVSSRPFREIDVEENFKSWDRVTKLEQGKVYVEVSDTLDRNEKLMGHCRAI
jgi:hypothetical protein